MGADLQGLYGISSPTRAAVGIVRRGLHLTRRSRDPDCIRARCNCAFIRDYTADFPVDRVRLTSIYTQGDGVVRWERAIVEEADCVEVTGSHIGLMANRKAYRAIADRPLRASRSCRRAGGAATKPCAGSTTHLGTSSPRPIGRRPVRG